VPLEAFRFTLMNQAKDYRNETKLNIKKLNEHAARCSDVSLDGVFGKNRFLCVAGNDGVIHAKKLCTVRRDFMPFASNLGNILGGLFVTLDSQRNVNTRVARYSILCNSEGVQYEE
jgi:hypothetical protein